MKQTSDVGDVQHATVEAGLPSLDAEAEELMATETVSADGTMTATSGAPRNILVSAAHEVQHDVMCDIMKARLTSVVIRDLAHLSMSVGRIWLACLQERRPMLGTPAQ